MNISCRVLKRSGRSIAVAFRDSAGMWRAAIVSEDAVDGDVRIGNEVGVSDKCIADGVEYGIDFEILMPHPCTITAGNLQQAMREHGIWTAEDVLKRPREAVAAIQSLVTVSYADLVNRVLNLIGG